MIGSSVESLDMTGFCPYDVLRFSKMRKHKVLNEIEDLEDFSGYSIDTDGNLWSLKYKVPKLVNLYGLVRMNVHILPVD